MKQMDEAWEEEFEEIVENEDFAPSNRSALALDMVKQLLTQKRTVTREWIEKELNAHLRLEDEALRDYVHVIADIIVEIFTAFGIEVMEK